MSPLSRPGWRLIAVLLLVVHASCRPAGTQAPALAQEPPGGELFEDVSTSSGIDFRFQSGEEAGRFVILQTLGGGVAVLDHDGDGRPDLFFAGGGGFGGTGNREVHGAPPRLYRNLGHGKFQDVTAAVGLDQLTDGQPWFYNQGCATADDDRDGWPDLLLTGYGRIALFRNVPDGKGGRRFRDATREAGLAGPVAWATSAAWGDLDGDGWPDLYLCQYVNWSRTNDPVCIGFDGRRRDICPPSRFAALPHRLYRNQHGVYTEVSGPAGLRQPRSLAELAALSHLDAAARKRLGEAAREADHGKGLGVVMVDLDGDGRPDLYVANDTTDNLLYRNCSPRGGPIQLEEIGLAGGVARDDRGSPNGSMGIAVGDLDGSGRPSLVVTNYENELHALYRNDSRPDLVFFHHDSMRLGLAALGHSYVGWGVAFADIDRDGLQDLVLVNGHPNFFPQRGGSREQLAVFLRRQDRFLDFRRHAGAYFNRPRNGRGLAVVDLDSDGRPDVVATHLHEPVALLRNTDDSNPHWLGVELIGRDRRDVTGARLVLEAGGRRQARFQTAGGSYLCSGDRRHLFGLGETERVERLTVYWPGGKVERYEGLGVDRYWRLEEGKGRD